MMVGALSMDLPQSRIRLSGSGVASEMDFRQVMQAVSDKTNLDGLFVQASQATGVPAALLKAVAKAESNFTPDAVSHCGAVGVMQLMPATARALGVSDPYNAGQNILGGAKYLRQMLDRYDGNTTLALAAYNAGPGSVDRYGGVPPYAETQNYVRKVMGYLGGDCSVPVSVSASSPTGVMDRHVESASAALSEIVQELNGTPWLTGEDLVLFCESMKLSAADRLNEILSGEADSGERDSHGPRAL